MEFTVDELNELLQKEFDRGVNSQKTNNITYMPNTTYTSDNTFIPSACRTCSKHPSNGGDGICNCTLGDMKITC